MRLGPRIRKPLGDLANEGFARLRGLYLKLIAADQGGHLAVAINAVLAEHFSRRYRAGRGNLIEDEIGRSLLRRHAKSPPRQGVTWQPTPRCFIAEHSASAALFVL